MRVREMTLREVQMKLVTPFEISVGRTELRRILLVETSVDGVTGWGECVAGESPSYSPETVDTAWHILRDFLWPLVKEKEFAAAADVWDLLEPVRGHSMAKGSLEAAIWDAQARREGLALSKLIGGRRQEIACGVSIGIKDSLEELVCAVKKELAAGYQRIKIKIKPGRDLEPVRRLRQDFPRIKLMVDANSAYTLNDWPLLKQLEGFYLMMIEQRACKIINIKLGRVGGYTVARRIHDLCQRHGIPVWCGGMLESGIGRAHNIALSTLPNFSLPGDVAASKRYWEEDIILPEVTVSPQGTIRVPSGPGIGFEPRLDRIDKLTVRKERLA